MRFATRLLLPLGALLLACSIPGSQAAPGPVTIHVGTRVDGTMYAQPATFTVSSGEPVQVTVINDDNVGGGIVGTPHDLAFEGVQMQRAGGECPNVPETARTERDLRAEFETCLTPQANGTFVAPTTPASYAYKCEIPGHAGKGMQGVMVVASTAAGAAPTATGGSTDPPGRSVGSARTPGFEGLVLLGGTALAVLLLRRRG